MKGVLAEGGAKDKAWIGVRPCGRLTTMVEKTIESYHEGLAPGDRTICEGLRAVITAELPEAEGRVWHGHPVWFLEGNPIVGYSKLKSCVRLLFWSGQGFQTPGLQPEGKFKAAEARFTGAGEVDSDFLRRWCGEARAIQWDYKNIVKRKGRLERLC